MGKKTRIIIPILVIIILVLVSYILYNKVFKEEPIKNNQDNCETAISIDDVVGRYEQLIEAESAEIPSTSYVIELFKNGIFSYRTARGGQIGVVGNYVINNNQIVLNYLLRTGSDTYIEPLKGSNTLTINDDNSITGIVKEFAAENKINVTLKKISSTPNGIDLKSWMSDQLCKDDDYCKNADSPM